MWVGAGLVSQRSPEKPWTQTHVYVTLLSSADPDSGSSTFSQVPPLRHGHVGAAVGALDGAVVGLFDGACDGRFVGACDGTSVGDSVVGWLVGVCVGKCEGALVGDWVVGLLVGACVGECDGTFVGD